MSSIGIIGSGFGIYGYLPAIIQSGVVRIYIPVKYQKKILKRSELRPYKDSVTWVSDEKELLDKVNFLVLAVPPDIQFMLLERFLGDERLKKLILEKPLAETPEKASSLLNKLIESNKKFRIGYNFRHASWSKQIADLINKKDTYNNVDRISINWSFLAPHFNTIEPIWKRFNSKGGGALRFYGIHLIALLAEFGYCQPLISKKFFSSKDEVSRWSCTFSGDQLPAFDVVVDSKASISKFLVSSYVGSIKTEIYSDQSPFINTSVSQLPGEDSRVPYLVNFFKSFEEPELYFKWYCETINLWQQVEDISTEIYVENQNSYEKFI